MRMIFFFLSFLLFLKDEYGINMGGAILHIKAKPLKLNSKQLDKYSILFLINTFVFHITYAFMWPEREEAVYLMTPV